MWAKNYKNRGNFDKGNAKIKWCTFLPDNVYNTQNIKVVIPSLLQGNGLPKHSHLLFGMLS